MSGRDAARFGFFFIIRTIVHPGVPGAERRQKTPKKQVTNLRLQEVFLMINDVLMKSNLFNDCYNTTMNLSLVEGKFSIGR
jgi:hypothetical protein